MGTLLAFFIIFLLLLILYFYSSSKRDSQLFKSRNVYQLQTSFNFIKLLLDSTSSSVTTLLDQYKEMAQAQIPVAANKQFGLITYHVIDPEILRNILIKDFDHFDRYKFQFPGKLPKKMLVMVFGDTWRSLRAKLSPVFTTGKIKRMFPILDSSSKKLVTFIQNQMRESPNNEIDLRHAYSKFTLDSIAAVACGMDPKVYETKELTQFEQMAKKVAFEFDSPLLLLRFMCAIMAPKLFSFFGLTLWGQDTEDFFSTAIKSAINYRKQTGTKGSDFIQLLLDTREESPQIDNLLDDDGIVSNCVVFISAGYNTNQSLLMFAAYSLALNPGVQDKLRQEVEGALDENQGEFTYEKIHEMVYLDMVISETLRFYPPSILFDRGCTKDYTFPGTNIQIGKGDRVIIPAFGIHHDERYFPNPEVFDPERFSPENKAKIPQYAYLPFGHGPRNCIGMRFALTQAKLAIAHLVYNFNIEPSQKTLIPMVYKNSASTEPKNGMWLSLKKIDHN